MLLVFLATMAWTGSPIRVEREVLIAFDLLLALVVGLVLYAASARDPQAPPDLFDALQLVLVVSALVVDGVALAAIAARISEFGFTPNRMAALGENLILLVNLAWSAWLYAQFLRGGAAVRRARALADRLPARLFRVGRARRHRLPAALRLPLSLRHPAGSSILKQYPSMRGILFDVEQVIAGASAPEALGVASRVEKVAGDFFTSIPRGGDAYVMKHIIHDWNDERAGLILRNVRTALEGTPRGKVILVEAVIKPGNEPDLSKLIDLEMMLLPGDARAHRSGIQGAVRTQRLRADTRRPNPGAAVGRRSGGALT